MLKEKASLLQKHGENLLGKKLKNHIADNIKSTTQTFSLSHSLAPRKSEEQKFFLTKAGSKKFHNDNQQPTKTGSQQQRYGRYNCSPANLQQGFESRKTNSVGIKKGPPNDKKTILIKKYPRCSISETIETFCRRLDENNKGSQNFGHSKRIQKSILFKKFSTNSESRRGRIGETRAKRNVEEGSHQKSLTIKRVVCKQLIHCKKEGWEPKTSDKLEAPE